MISAIAIDDEPLALAVIEQFCGRDGDISLKTFSDPVEGLAAVNRDRPVLVFLDVEMNGVSGIDVARTLPEGTFLIFTTAYAQFALDGFELNAVDFLHKPFSYQRFGAALQKVRTLIRLKSAAETAGKAGGEITVKSEYKSVSLSVSGIRYIEAMDNYSKIYMTGGDPVLTQMSLKEMSDLLPAGKFVRIHRSFIIPLNKVSRYSSRTVTLSCGVTLPVGRSYSADFRQSVGGHC